MADAIHTERMTYPATEGDLKAYLARPTEGAPWPAIIVIQEVFGLVDHIEDVARRFAAEGYLALAPDLYTHDTVRPTLEDEDIVVAFPYRGQADKLAELPPGKRESIGRALEWLTKRNLSTYVPDLIAGVNYLRTRSDVRPAAIGAVGFCMGGGLVGQLVASGADIAAGVIFYGPPPPLDKVGNVRCPVQGHYGGEDPGITNNVPAFEEAMRAAGKDFAAFVYEGAPHAFNNDQRPSFHGEAAKVAWGRTLEFFQEHLKGAPVGAR